MQLPEDFKEIASSIGDYLFGHAITQLGADRTQELLKTDEGAHEFHALCHEGYWRGQDLLLAELQRVQADKRANKKKLKAARRKRRGNLRREADAERRVLVREEAVLRRLADGLAWVLLGMRRWEIRRLWQGETPPTLAESNLESVLRMLDVLREDPQQFGLLSDLTPTIQMGDIILAQPTAGRVAIVEVKEGATNLEIAEFLHSFVRTRCVRALQLFRAERTESEFKQFERMLRQYSRMSQAYQFTRQDHGTDPRTGERLALSKNVFELETYEHELNQALKEASEHGESRFTVDGCLLVMAFRHDALPFPAYRAEVAHAANHFLTDECLLRDDDLAEGADLDRLINWSALTSEPWELDRNLFSPDVQPLFLLALEPSLLKAVAFGEVRVALVLDVGRFVDLMREHGVDVELRRPTKKERSQQFHQSALTLDGQYIVASKDGFQIILGSGYKAQMLLEAARPSSVAKMTADVEMASPRD